MNLEWHWKVTLVRGKDETKEDEIVARSYDEVMRSYTRVAQWRGESGHGEGWIPIEIKRGNLCDPALCDCEYERNLEKLHFDMLKLLGIDPDFY